MAQDKFNLDTMPNEQDQRVLKQNSKLNEKASKQSAKLKKRQEGAASKVETGSAA